MIWAGYGQFNLATIASQLSTANGSRLVQPQVAPAPAPSSPTTPPKVNLTSFLSLPTAQTFDFTKLATAQMPTPTTSTRRAPPSGDPAQDNLIRLMNAATSYAAKQSQPPSTSSVVGLLTGGAASNASGSGSASGGGALPQSQGAAGGDTQLQVKQACASVGGTWAIDGCLFPDGAKLGVGSDGNAYCMNSVGRCAGAGAAAAAPAAGGIGRTAMIGAAAIAALMLLR